MRRLLLSTLILLAIPGSAAAGKFDRSLAPHRYTVSLSPSVARVLPWGNTTAGATLEVAGGGRFELGGRLDLHPLVVDQPGNLLGVLQGFLRRYLRPWPKGIQPRVDVHVGLGIGTFFGNACTTEHACGGTAPRMDLEAGVRLGLAEHWDLQANARLGMQTGSALGYEHAFSPTFGLALRWRSSPRANNAR
ncbi:MAG: hypothetical protein P1V51_02155 [Deltaproteobacteria bacterium]|nr:hypothetical protein [Deltaproteobacteria bacterium]